jgi:hypothetical protein
LAKTTPMGLNELVPDAFVEFTNAYQEQFSIGWEQWIRGRITSSWGIIQNQDRATNNLGIRFNTAKMLPGNLHLTVGWYKTKKEHNTNGDPDTRKKEKLIEIIQDEAKNWKHGMYDEKELQTEKLLKLPTKNIKMLLENIKKSRRNDKTKQNNIQ